MLKFRYFILGLGIIILGSSQGFLYAQQYTIQTYQPTKKSPYVTKKECIDKFDFDQIDPRQYFLANEGILLLRDYLRCRAVVDEDVVYGLFKRLGIDERFLTPYTLVFCTALIRETKVSLQLINWCKQAELNNVKSDECRDFIKAFMTKDVSFCSRDEKECIGYISLNENLVTGRNKDIIYYLKALKNLDIEKCEKINDKLFKRACKAYITQDKKICEDEGFKKFRDIYCSEIIQVKGGDRLDIN
jgi:hypothetical protein